VCKKIFLILLFIVIIFSSCGGRNTTFAPDLNDESEAIYEAVNSSEEEAEEAPDDTVECVYPDITPLSGATAPYAPLLNAYAEFERGGFLFYDADLNVYREFEGRDSAIFNKELIGDSIIVRWGEYIGPTPRGGTSPPIFYAFHDINGDGVPELFIGANEWSDVISIAAIYNLQGGEPVSVTQIGGRVGISLQTDTYGGYVIEAAWGHMGSAGEYFYSLNENGELILLDALYTGPVYTDEGQMPWIGRGDYDEAVEITLEEYTELIIHYGASGYAIYAFFVDGILTPRSVNLEWMPIGSFEHNH